MANPKFKKALLYSNHEGVSDLFSSQPEYQFVFDHTDASIDVLKSIDDLILRQKKIKFLPPLNDLFSIGRHIYRSGSLVDPFLHVYATAVIMAMQYEIEEFRSLTEPNTVFSYRMIEGSNTEWFDPSIGWGKFNETNVKLAKNSDVVVSADIASFYSSLRPAHFNSYGFLRIFSGANEIRLQAILKYMNLEERGLPVGGSFARILAEILLAHIDIELKKEGVIFTRFVDDFRIFSKDKGLISREIYILTKILNNYGLHINRQKISVLKNDEFIETLKFKSASLVSNNDQKSTITNPLFDPYTELVISRVDELKAISETQSLHQATIYEMEKISADVTSLKVIMSAAKYCSTEECFLVISEILKNLHRPETYIIMLRISQLIEFRNLEFSSSILACLSEKIEHVFIQKRHSLPLSVQALLLNARLNIDTILGYEFEQLLGGVYHQSDNDHLNRNIYILLATRSKNDEVFQSLNCSSKHSSFWIKSLQDLVHWKKTSDVQYVTNETNRTPLHHLISNISKTYVL